ncbi:MFS transporter [Bartonella sp. DGB1]|uniref:MFS transporter n=1 Tax=Bartonella sp. DGB1 TaxID=3239807 RepID=UPI003525B99F
MEKDQNPFRVKAYAHLLSLNILSFAIAITDFTLILSILTYTFEVSAMEIGYATALYGLPGVIFGVFIGRFSDSRDPFIILYASVFLKLIVAISLMFAPNVYFFIFMVFIKGIANTLGVAPGQFLLRAILNDKQLVANNSFMTVAFQLTKILAPLVTAAIILSMGMNSFLISVLLCLLSLPQIYFIKFYHRHIAKMRSSKAKASIFALYSLLQQKKNYLSFFFLHQWYRHSYYLFTILCFLFF